MTTAGSKYADPALKPKLDPSFYSLEVDEIAFFEKLTGIHDDEELKKHIIDVQAKAYEIYGYPCIRTFAFTKMRISRLPGYHDALKLLKERENPILLDIGCCFGGDTRKAVIDGWPVQYAVASDIRQGFWDYGHELFKSTLETFPAPFIAGDIFDPAMLAPRGAFIDVEDISNIASNVLPDLNELTSLTPLQGKVSAIHASSFFHLFSGEKQLELARLLASLLSPEKGSVIFGRHISMPQKGLIPNWPMFCHSPESWKEIWANVFDNKDGRGGERVKVDAELVEIPTKVLLKVAVEPTRGWLMTWSVTRL